MPLRQAWVPHPFRPAAWVCCFTALSLAGCGSGAAAPSPTRTSTDGLTATQDSAVAAPTAGSTPMAFTPLPLQTDTPLPTGVPRLPEGCVDALDVTLDDYGRYLCVGGTITQITMQGGEYRVYFGPRGKLYMLGYDWVDRIGLQAGECAYAEGVLSRNVEAAAPVMPITPYSLRRCPVVPPASAPPRPANLPAQCAYALEITRDDAGRKLCVGGAVVFSEWEGSVYRIYFFTDKNFGLHFVSRQWTGRGVNAGDCIYVTEQTIALDPSTGTPILNVVPGNVTFCPA
ncbi:MAG: hypothetical protein JW929_14690 [Anaerolineales bacterium]|nr:hypothetical protein [Anaerolineales bacterium]